MGEADVCAGAADRRGDQPQASADGMPTVSRLAAREPARAPRDTRVGIAGYRKAIRSLRAAALEASLADKLALAGGAD